MDITNEDEETEQSFADLGVHPALCNSIASVGWKKPTQIQSGSIPESLKGRDIIGLAETG